MADDRVLTSDNSLLSRPNIEPLDGPRAAYAHALGHSTCISTCAGACTTTLLQAEVEANVQAGIAPATERVYRAAGRASGRAKAAFDAKPVILGLSGKVAEGREPPIGRTAGTGEIAGVQGPSRKAWCPPEARIHRSPSKPSRGRRAVSGGGSGVSKIVSGPRVARVQGSKASTFSRSTFGDNVITGAPFCSKTAWITTPLAGLDRLPVVVSGNSTF